MRHNSCHAAGVSTWEAPLAIDWAVVHGMSVPGHAVGAGDDDDDDDGCVGTSCDGHATIWGDVPGMGAME